MSRTAVIRLLGAGLSLAVAACSSDHATPESPLHVASISPADGEVEVAETAALSVTFSVAPDARTIVGTGQILLVDQAGLVLASSEAVADTVVTVTPGAALVDGRTYGLAVRPGVATPIGQRLAAPVAVRFSTGPTLVEIPGFPPFDGAAEPPKPPGSFAAVGPLGTARRRPVAAPLTDGRVFVHGGLDSAGLAVGTAEVYRPATQDFAAAGLASPAPAGRWDHTATILTDGRVLLAGGTAGGPALTTTPIWDPATDAWVVSGGLVLNAARSAHGAVLLADGRVLVAGGWATAALASAELFDPSTGTWTVTGALATARANHTLTLLADGRVLAAGGSTGSASLASAELWSAGTGTWVATGGPLLGARSRHTATLLTAGAGAGFVLVAGGWNAGGSPAILASCELFDPAGNGGTGLFATTTAALPEARADHSATALVSGKVLLAGGSSLAPPSACGTCGVRATAAVFEATAGTGALGSGLAGLVTGSTCVATATASGGQTFLTGIVAGRAEHAGVRLADGTVLLLGGTDCGPCSGGTGPVALASAERHTP